jgi:hypothetical protein
VPEPEMPVMMTNSLLSEIGAGPEGFASFFFAGFDTSGSAFFRALPLGFVERAMRSC